MRFPWVPLAAPFLLALVACGATLTRGPAGWHETATPYSITPLESGDLFPAGWALDGYEARKDGFRRNDTHSEAFDFKLKRVEDDGVLLVAHYFLEDEDRAKRPEVLADRWIDRLVQNPKSDDGASDVFAPVIPKLEMTATGTVGLRSLSSTEVRGRAVQVDLRGPFTVPAGEGAEITATLAPVGAPPDRRLYVALVKQMGGNRYAIVAYGNTPTMFEKGLADATSFAHRVHF
jgi:hypothetical protein